MCCAVGESRIPTISRSPEPESESLLNHRRQLAPWRGQPPHGVTERHALPRPSGGKSGGGGAPETVSGGGRVSAVAGRLHFEGSTHCRGPVSVFPNEVRSGLLAARSSRPSLRTKD